MNERPEQPSGTPGLRNGANTKRGRLRGGDARTDQIQSEIDQELEPSALDRDEDERRGAEGRVQPEPPENTRAAREGEADEIGIEIDHAAERPRQD